MNGQRYVFDLYFSVDLHSVILLNFAVLRSHRCFRLRETILDGSGLLRCLIHSVNQIICLFPLELMYRYFLAVLPLVVATVIRLPLFSFYWLIQLLCDHPFIWLLLKSVLLKSCCIDRLTFSCPTVF